MAQLSCARLAENTLHRSPALKAEVLSLRCRVNASLGYSGPALPAPWE